MKKNTKEDIQVVTAVVMLIVGVGMSAAGFFAQPIGEIHDSVLWIFAQCLTYAGTIFGISTYVRGKVREIEEKVADKLNDKDYGNGNKR